MSVAKIKLWGKIIGAVSWDQDREIAYFEYDKAFAKSGIQVAPLTMPLSEEVYSFPALNKETFKGLPGFLADSLPDKFGNALIDAWLARNGRAKGDFSPVERLCYIGKRGMGALEFEPTQGPRGRASKKIDVDQLVELASEILSERKGLNASFSEKEREEAVRDILRVGTSAGGARAKAIIAWNPKTNEVRSGQVGAGQGYSYWLLKFDGVKNNKDKELEDPKGFGLIEYVYYKMACDAGIIMSECRLLKENGRNHFMTKRFDRTEDGAKIHMQSLCAMRHYDFNMARAYSYEQAFQTIRDLGLTMDDIEEQFRRMAFNILGRNQDDHVKNIAFLMNKAGEWSLSPAFDMTYSYNPDGDWTNAHQMTMNGKSDNFTFEDFQECASVISMKKTRVADILEEVWVGVSKWSEYAEEEGIDPTTIRAVKNTHRKIGSA